MSLDSSGFVNEVKERHSIASVIGRHMRLEKRGHLLKGLCPFHGEKSPSFVVYEPQGTYHCFGCGVHGDIFTFTMDIEKLTFPEALEKLARDVGLTVPQDKNTILETNAGAFAALKSAAAFYAACLNRPGGQKVRDYLKTRDIDDAIAQEFGLGHAPQGSVLGPYLDSQKHTEKDVLKAGLIGFQDENTQKKRSYDRFRGRLMFPIQNIKGQVIAFGGRSLDGNDAKYLNSPETPLFHKGRILYNLNRAQKAVRDGASLIVAEGYMDVISLWKHGFRGAVAPLGTALTSDQMTLLWKTSPTPLFAFDGDFAGQKAAVKSALTALSLLSTGLNAAFIMLPETDDPDSFVQKKGAASFQKLIDQALLLPDFIWKSYVIGQPALTPDQKSTLQKTVLNLVETIPDGVLKNHYKRDFQERFYTYYRSLNDAAKLWNKGKLTPPQKASGGAVSAGFSVSKILLGCLYYHPALIYDCYEDLMFLTCDDSSMAHLKEAYLGWLSHESFSENQTDAEKRAAFQLFLTGKNLDPLCAPFRQMNFRQLCPPARQNDMAKKGVLDYWKKIYDASFMSKGLDADRLDARKELTDNLSAEAWERLKVLESQRQIAKTTDDGEVDSSLS